MVCVVIVGAAARHASMCVHCIAVVRTMLQFWETLVTHSDVGLIHNEESASVSITVGEAAAFWGELAPVGAPSLPAAPAPPVVDVFDDMD